MRLFITQMTEKKVHAFIYFVLAIIIEGFNQDWALFTTLVLIRSNSSKVGSVNIVFFIVKSTA